MCTNLKMRPAADGTVVVGRTMEFPDLIPWDLQVIAPGQPRTAHGPSGGMSWTPAHAVVGIGAFSDGLLADGMNTAGVSAHALYMDGFCHYADPVGDGTDISEMDVIAYLLGTCATVDEVRRAAATMNVIGVDPGTGFPPPLHFLVHDAHASLAIEFRPEGMSIVDNPVGVGTNPPYLDWHLTNLRNYVGLAAANPRDDVDGRPLVPLGQGGGLRGLPGDYTPPSRFVRAVAMVELTDQAADGAAAEATCLHVLNAFDIPAGIITEQGPDGRQVDEITDWVTVANLSDRRYGYRVHGDPRPYVIDLAGSDLATTRRVPLPGPARFTEAPI